MKVLPFLAPSAFVAGAAAMCWLFNVAGWPGGSAAVFGLLALGTPLVARGCLRKLEERGLWTAAALLVGVLASAVLVARAAPGHHQLESRLDGLAVGSEAVATVHEGSSTCRPRCAIVRRTYVVASSPDVAMVTAMAVLLAAGFTPPRRPAASTLPEPQVLSAPKVLATVDAQRDDALTTLTVTLQSRRWL